MPFSFVEDHERGILLVETWGCLSQEAHADLIRDLIRSDFARENGKLLVDHTKLEKMDGSYQVSQTAASRSTLMGRSTLRSPI